MHKSVTLRRVMRLVQEDNYRGICTACGKGAYGVEPDARGYSCDSCAAQMVSGAEELLLELA